MTAAIDSLRALSGRLTDRQDRETYAALVVYLNSLPSGDEFLRLAELFGLLALIGQSIPEAIGDLVTELRKQVSASADYREQVNARLAGLPLEIAAGVDVAAIIKSLNEGLRQQFAASGLESTVTSLRGSTKEIIALSGQLPATLKPLMAEYKSLATAISTELPKLTAASVELQNHNARLVVQERASTYMWEGAAALVLLLIGGLCGIVFEKGQSRDALDRLERRVEQLRRIVVATVDTPVHSGPKKEAKGSQLVSGGNKTP